jgi:ABC-type sugar transport system permease subunit
MKENVSPVLETGKALPKVKSKVIRNVAWVDRLAPYLFISPFILFFLALFIGPSIYSLVLSFFRYKGYGDATFVGIANYVSILQYHVFWTELVNTIFYWLVHVIPLMVGAFLLAVLVRSKFIKGQRFFKPVLFVPNIVATVAAALVFQSLFGTQYGVINKLLGTQIDWLHDPTITKFVVVLLLIWKGLGWWFIIFLVGLTSINPELEEAATVDGASVRQRLVYIVIPLMRNIFLFAFVIDAINSLRMFTEPNVLVGRSGQLADPEVAPLLNLLISNLRGASFGQASAVGWILFVLTLGITLIQFRILRSSDEER